MKAQTLKGRQALNTLKGFRDFLPEQARKRQYVIDTLRKVFESYGFEPLETPALEYAETLTNKYGEEANKLIYLFKDRGGRKVGLRYDLTVPLARVVAQYQNELPIPFKRYQIGPVWRADKPQAGRYREFWQADIDTVGSASVLADAEVVVCALSALEELGFKDRKVLISDRKFLDQIGVTPELAIIIDKQGKVGREQVQKELAQKIGQKRTKIILQNLEQAAEPTSIKQLRELVSDMGGNQEEVVFDPWLCRGLEYYTGPIFEIKVGGSNLSIGGGGRYDQLIGKFAGRDLPAVGISFGIDRTIEALAQSDSSVSTTGTTAQVLVTVLSRDLIVQSTKVGRLLRETGIYTEVYPDEQTKLDKQLKYANQKGIPYVVIIGPEEVEKDMVTLKNMQTGEQEAVPVEKLIEKLS